MGGHKNILAKLISCLVLMVVVLLTAEPTDGQVPIPSADKAKTEGRPTDQGVGATGATPTGAEANPTKIATNSTNTEVGDKDVKDGDKDVKAAAPSTQPASRPQQPPASCKRTLKAEVVALVLQALLHGARGGRELDVERDRAAADADVLHEPERDDVPVQVRILDPGQCLQNLLFRDSSHGGSPHRAVPARLLAWLRLSRVRRSNIASSWEC